MSLLLNHVIDIPPAIAVCPYCNGRLSARVEEIEITDDVAEIPSSIFMECDTEPDWKTHAWNEWDRAHSYMPFFHWHPVQDRVLRWLRRRTE